MLKLINLRALTCCQISKQLAASCNIIHRSTANNSPTTDDEHENKDFKLVYKLPFIRHATVLNKLKIWQGGATLLSIPTCLLLQQVDILTMGHVYSFAYLGLSGCIALGVVGKLATNLIGLVHLNTDNTKARVAYLDFWGRRKNIEIQVNDVVPGSEAKPSYFFHYLQRYSTKQNLKFVKKLGIYKNKQDFQDMFGIV